MAELKPCPFCGSKNLSLNRAFKFVWIECQDCTCEGPDEDNEDEAIKLWNRRAEDV